MQEDQGLVLSMLIVTSVFLPCRKSSSCVLSIDTTIVISVKCWSQAHLS